MPKQYEAIRDKLSHKGMSYDKAQSSAAAIYNAKHPKAPVTGRSERPKTRPKTRTRKKSKKKEDFDFMRRRRD